MAKYVSALIEEWRTGASEIPTVPELCTTFNIPAHEIDQTFGIINAGRGGDWTYWCRIDDDALQTLIKDHPSVFRRSID